MRILTVVWAVCACGRVSFDPIAHDAFVAPTSPFGAPQLLLPLPPGAITMDDPTLTGDLRELYAEIQFGLASDIHVMTRASTTAPWSDPVLVSELSDATLFDTNPELSHDGLTLHVSIAESDRLKHTSRAMLGAMWSPLVSTGILGHGLTVDASGRLAVYHVEVATGQLPDNDLYQLQRASPAEPWGAPVALDAINTGGNESNAMLHAAGLQLFFERDGDVFVATRASVAEPFATVSPVSEINTPALESDPWVSPDLRTLVFVTDRDGARAFYIVTRE